MPQTSAEFGQSSVMHEVVMSAKVRGARGSAMRWPDSLSLATEARAQELAPVGSVPH